MDLSPSPLARTFPELPSIDGVTLRVARAGYKDWDRADLTFAELAEGITVDGVDYKPITAVFDRETGANSWLTVTLSEGKKREVRRALEAVNLMVNRLIRVQYGPFLLDDLRPGAVEEVPTDLLQQAIGHLMTNEHAARPAEPARTSKKPAPKSRLGSRSPSGKLTFRKRTKPR